MGGPPDADVIGGGIKEKDPASNWMPGIELFSCHLVARLVAPNDLGDGLS